MPTKCIRRHSEFVMNRVRRTHFRRHTNVHHFGGIAGRLRRGSIGGTLSPRREAAETDDRSWSDGLSTGVDSTSQVLPLSALLDTFVPISFGGLELNVTVRATVRVRR